MKHQRQRARPAFEMSVEDFLATCESRYEKRMRAQARMTTTTLNRVIVEKTPSEIRREVLQAEKDGEQ